MVAEQGPLAEIVVPGLHPLGEVRVADNLIDPGPELFHLFEIDKLHDVLRIEGLARRRRRAQPGPYPAEEIRPAVRHDICVRMLARRDVCEEVFHSCTLPPLRLATKPAGIRG